MPKLSIVIPCYNSEKFISKTIQSVLNQSFHDWEMIVVNDGSTDNSAFEVSRYIYFDKRIKLFSVENGGVNKARNFGYTKINMESEYLHFLDSDDTLEPHFYSKLIKFLNDNLEYGAVYSNHTFINEIDEKIPTPKWGKRLIPTRFWLKEIPEDDVVTPFSSIVLWCKIVEPMVIMRRKLFDESKRWDESFGFGRIGEGVILFSEFALKSKVGYLNYSLYNYRRHQNQSSQYKINEINPFDETFFKLINSDFINKSHLNLISLKYRYKAYKISKTLLFQLRTSPIYGIGMTINFIYKYFKSFRLIFQKYNE